MTSAKPLAYVEPGGAALSVNKVLLIGNLGKDPEVRFTPSGRAVARFPIATSEAWTDQQARSAPAGTTSWCGESRPRPAGSTSPRVARSTLKAASTPRQYDDKEGNKRYITEITAQRVQFLGGRGGGGGDSARGGEDMPPPPQGGGGPAAEDDDIPF